MQSPQAKTLVFTEMLLELLKTIAHFTICCFFKCWTLAQGTEEYSHNVFWLGPWLSLPHLYEALTGKEDHYLEDEVMKRAALMYCLRISHPRQCDSLFHLKKTLHVHHGALSCQSETFSHFIGLTHIFIALSSVFHCHFNHCMFTFPANLSMKITLGLCK